MLCQHDVAAAYQIIASSGLPPQEAPVTIAEKRKLFFLSDHCKAIQRNHSCLSYILISVHMHDLCTAKRYSPNC